MTDDATSPVQQLLDIEQIKQLKARYFRLMDMKQWDDWGMVFATDCVMEVPEADMVNHGREEIVTNVSTALVGARTAHHGHMPEIEITSDTTATGIWSMEDMLQWPEGGPMRTLHGYGHYHETYEKLDGDWRIKTMKLTRLRRDVDFG
jgi:hypothetical protein